MPRLATTTLLLLAAGVAGAHLTHRSGATPLIALRGGGKKVAKPSEPRPEPPALKVDHGNELQQYLVCAGIIGSWILLATIVFAINEKWPLAQSLFYAVDTGMSIGFGAVAEQKLSTKLFTIAHVLLGASAVGGAIALFADNAISESSQIAAAEYTQASLQAAFDRADADSSGVLSADEFASALEQHSLALTPEELAQARVLFDPDGDGAITVTEFMDAVGPYVSAERTVSASIRLAMARRAEPLAKRLLRSALEFAIAQRTLLLWAAWILAGAVWGVIAEGWDPITALYFAVGGLATGGLQAPSLTDAGVLRPSSATFVALWCLTGIPIFGMALGQFASVFVARFIAAKERAAIDRAISDEEFDFATGLFKKDGKIDQAEFMALELLRLGKVEMGTLELIKREFERLDADNDGALSAEEVKMSKGVVPAKKEA